MPWINLTIIVVFAAAAIIFVFQNLETVTLSFLSFSVNAPMAIFIFVIYLLGAATGGSLFALLRRSYQGSRGAWRLRHHQTRTQAPIRHRSRERPHEE